MIAQSARLLGDVQDLRCFSLSTELHLQSVRFMGQHVSARWSTDIVGKEPDVHSCLGGVGSNAPRQIWVCVVWFAVRTWSARESSEKASILVKKSFFLETSRELCPFNL